MMHNNILGSFSFDVVKRMLDVLSENGSGMKKTNLASKAGLNYNVCLRYIQMLKYLGWIEANPEVSITGEGKGVYVKLLGLSEPRVRNIGGHDYGDWHINIGEESIEYASSFEKSSSITHTRPALSLFNERQPFSESIQQTDNDGKKKNNYTIMIVDDDKDVARIYECFLSSVGYNVRKFIDSRSALREYVSDPFLYDLLVLDIRMKDINGLQLYQSIKSINPECRAIFVSCLDSAREVVSVLPGTRLEDIIRKPVTKAQFVSAVENALIQYDN
jgi:PleD family two-component response regulator